MRDVAETRQADDEAVHLAERLKAERFGGVVAFLPSLSVSFFVDLKWGCRGWGGGGGGLRDGGIVKRSIEDEEGDVSVGSPEVREEAEDADGGGERDEEGEDERGAGVVEDEADEGDAEEAAEGEGDVEEVVDGFGGGVAVQQVTRIAAGWWRRSS